MKAKIKSGTFLAESCGRATTQKYHFFLTPPIIAASLKVIAANIIKVIAANLA